MTAVGHGLDTDARLRDLEIAKELHNRQLEDHEEVLKSIQEHLGKLVDQFSRFQTRVLVIGAIFFSGTDGGQQALDKVLSFLT